MRRYITSHSANAIFISIITLTLEYCTGVWACCGEVNSGIIETLQKRVGRIVIKALCKVLFSSLKLPRPKA